MKPNKGIFQDAEFDDQPPGTWRTAKNIVPDGPNIVKNEPGFSEVTGLPADMLLLGQVVIPGDKIIVFLIGDPLVDSTLRELGIIDNDAYTKLSSNNIVFDTWDINYPIYGSHIVNSEGEIIIAFTDNNSPPGLVNIGLGNSEIFFNSKNDVRLFPETLIPTIHLDSVLNGGSLGTGVYYFFFSYEAADGSTTNWMQPSNPVTVVSSSYFDNYDQITGDPADTPGGKVITLRLTNIDTSYSKLKMAVLKKIDSVVSAEDVSSFIITKSGGDMLVAYNGDEETQDLLVEELVSDFATYQRAKALKIFNDVLYLGNTKEDNVLDYQKYANNIVLEWYTGNQVSMDSGRGSYKDSQTIFTRRSFEPGEAYAFYIRFILKDGTSSPAFHIPGRPADHIWNPGGGPGGSDVWQLVGGSNERDYLSDVDFTEFTSINNRARYFHFHDTSTWDGGATKKGMMGYWENLDEKYPGQGDHDEYIGEGYDSENGITQNARNLYAEPGGYIKHHRFPSLMKLADWGFPIITESALGQTAPVESFSDTYYIQGDSLFLEGSGNPPNYFRASYGILYENGLDSDTFDTVEIDYLVNLSFFFDSDQFPQGNLTDWNNQYNITMAIGPPDAMIDYLDGLSTFTWDIDIVAGTSFTANGKTAYCVEKVTIDDSNYANGIVLQTTVTPGTVVIQPGDAVIIHINHQNNNDVSFPNFVGPRINGPIDISVEGEGVVSGAVGGTKFSYPLGVIANNIKIPVEIRNKIQGFDIMYAEKTLGNSLNLGYSVLHDENDPLSASVVAAGNGVRLYPPDLLLFKPNNKPSHLQVQLLSKTSIGNGSTFAVEWDGSIPDTFAPQIADTLTTDWAVPILADAVTGFQNTTRHTVIKLEDAQYLDGDNTAGIVNNGFREAAYYAKLPNDFSSPGRVLVSLMAFKSSLYNSLYEQPLVATGKFFQVPDDEVQYDISALPQGSRVMYGGDKFIQPVHQRITAPWDGVADNYNIPWAGNTTRGRIAWTVTPMFTTMNYGLVHEGSEWYEKFFPKTVKSIGQSMPVGFSVPEDYDGNGKLHVEGGGSTTNDNRDKGHYLMTLDQQRDYNTDYTSINNVDQSGVPFDPDLTYVQENDTLITRSLKTNTANPLANIRKFLANDIYEMPKDKEGIEIIESLGDTIMVHMKHGLYRTVGKEILQPSSTAEIVLGTGDIFEREPRLVAFSGQGGFTGTRSRFAAVSSRLGYFFIDDRQGKVFLLSDSLEEVSAKGLRNFFRDTAKLSVDQDNPYTGVGYTACYDRKYNRIILTKKDGAGSFTLSYAGDTQSWYSYHDYLPVALFSSDQSYAAGSDGKIFKMNDESTKGIYLDDTINPSYIDAVFTFGTPGGVAARVRAFTWKTNVVDPAGINIRNATIDKIMVYNKHQNSGLIDVTSGPRALPEPNVPTVANTRNVHNSWRFNKFRDISVRDNNSVLPPYYELNLSTIQSELEWHKRKRFIDSFVVLRLQTDNAVGVIGQNTVYLYNADVDILPNIVR
jgi:hypothetical protein